jgi:shikimate dehydrogenase
MNRAFSVQSIAAMYVAVGVPAAGAGESIGGMKTLGFAGANVTYPLKEAVLPFVDRESPTVATIGAANTLMFTSEGVAAENTDAIGTVVALEVFGATQLLKKRVLILGAGGAGRAAAFGLLAAGADSVAFAVRDKGKAKKSIDGLRHAFPGKVIDIFESQKLASDAERLLDRDIVINATPLGMEGFEPGPLADRSLYRRNHMCFDFVYHPRTTPFLQAAGEQGAKTLDGLALLVAQAEAGFHRWTGRHFSLAEMYDDVVEHLESERSAHQANGMVSS